MILGHLVLQDRDRLAEARKVGLAAERAVEVLVQRRDGDAVDEALQKHLALFLEVCVFVQVQISS